MESGQGRFINAGSLRAQTAVRGVVVPCYQHHNAVDGVDNNVPQLHATLSESLDYNVGVYIHAWSALYSSNTIHCCILYL